MKAWQTIEQIEKAAKAMGYRVDTHAAQTNSAYIKVSDGASEVTVRVSDHMECYPPKPGERQLSVSEFELTAAQAIRCLRVGLANIAPYEPAPPSKEEVEYLKDQAARKNAEGAAWRKIREALTDADRAEWNERTGNGRHNQKSVAKDIAKRNGWKVRAAYMALTNGRAPRGNF